jgi:hypothetical protein
MFCFLAFQVPNQQDLNPASVQETQTAFDFTLFAVK